RISVLNPGGKVHARVIHEKAGTIFDGQVAPGEDFIVPLKNVPKGFLTVRAEFSTPEDGVIVSEMRYFNGLLKRHPRVAMLNENGFPLLEKDKPFFPIGTYGAPVEDYGVLKKAGYNFVVASIKDLDKVQQAGLKAAVSVHGSKEDGFKNVRETIAKYKNHPAVLCWMLYDEPAYNRAEIYWTFTNCTTSPTRPIRCTPLTSSSPRRRHTQHTAAAAIYFRSTLIL
ncbi:MAG: hypothetical protein GXO75_00560, partial [Calditrichaeota bacterium]|nr:hypothetical protein [Calditrichota bacterium]